MPYKRGNTTPDECFTDSGMRLPKNKAAETGLNQIYLISDDFDFLIEKEDTSLIVLDAEETIK